MMDDLINRQAAIEALMEILDRPNHAEFLYTDEICKALSAMPSAQPEHKKGKWILHREHERIVYDIPPEGPEPPYHRKITPTYKCSECGFISFDYAPNFCEECGADMRREQK